MQIEFFEAMGLHDRRMDLHDLHRYGPKDQMNNTVRGAPLSETPPLGRLGRRKLKNVPLRKHPALKVLELILEGVMSDIAKAIVVEARKREATRLQSQQEGILLVTNAITRNMYRLFLENPVESPSSFVSTRQLYTVLRLTIPQLLIFRLFVAGMALGARPFASCVKVICKDSRLEYNAISLLQKCRGDLSAALFQYLSTHCEHPSIREAPSSQPFNKTQELFAFHGIRYKDVEATLVKQQIQLSHDQRTAVTQISDLRRHVVALRGPPGSSKTTLLVGTFLHLTRTLAPNQKLVWLTKTRQMRTKALHEFRSYLHDPCTVIGVGTSENDGSEILQTDEFDPCIPSASTRLYVSDA